MDTVSALTSEQNSLQRLTLQAVVLSMRGAIVVILSFLLMALRLWQRF
jgi:hypothetical protein